MCMAPEKCTKLFKGVVSNLIKIDPVRLIEEGSINAEYKRYLEMVVMKNGKLFLNFDKRKTDWINSLSLMLKA